MKVLKIAVSILLLVLAIHCTMAVSLDNSGGGSWKYVAIFTFNNTCPRTSQYCINISKEYINITNSTGYIKASLLDPSFWSFVQENGSDIRVTNQSAQLYFWIKKFNYTDKSATIWVNVTKGSNELRLYYGNPSASDSVYNNINKTVLFYEGFEEGAAALSKFEGYTSALSIASPGIVGNYYLSVAATYADNYWGEYFTHSIPRDIVMTGYAKAVSTVGTIRWGLLSTWDNLSSDSPYGYWIIYSPGTGGIYLTSNTASTLTGTTVSSTGVISTNWMKFTMVVTNDSVILKYAGAKLILNDITYTSFHLWGGDSYRASGFDDILIVYNHDPIKITNELYKETGITINSTIINVTYNSYNITGKLILSINGTIEKPNFWYIPSNVSSTGFLATGSTTVNATINVTMYLANTLSLNKIICNGSIITPQYIGVTNISGEEYNEYNFTTPSAGLLTIYANATPVTKNFIGGTIHLTTARYMPIETIDSIDNVNKTFGANISIFVNTSTQLENIEYNGTNISPDYIGITNINNGSYYEYTYSTNESGVLIVSTNVTNAVYNTTIYADNSTNFTKILCGEPIRIVSPVYANISIGTYTKTGVKEITKRINLPTIIPVTVRVLNTSKMVFGLYTCILDITWGQVNITLLSTTNKTIKMPYSIYNDYFEKITTNPNKLYAGWNKITVYYIDQPIKTYTFYLNHSNQGKQIILHLNVTRMNSTCYQLQIVSSKKFEVHNLSPKIPLGQFAINHSKEVIIHFINNSPLTVRVDNGDYSYCNPYLYIYGSGNNTITAYYQIKMNVESTLGIPLNTTITLNNEKLPVYGYSYKILPVNVYNISFPKKTLDGFILKSTNMSHYSIKLTKNMQLPEIEYKVPTELTMHIYKENTSVSWLHLPIPLPVILSTNTGNGEKAYIFGKLSNWYNSPVPYANITLKITSLKTGYTITKHLTTSVSGSFNVSFDVASGVNYSISAIYEGSDVYVGSYKHIVVAGGALPPVPSSNKHNLIVLSAIAVTILGIGIGLLAYVLHKRSLSKAMNKLNKGKYFRRIK